VRKFGADELTLRALVQGDVESVCLIDDAYQGNGWTSPQVSDTLAANGGQGFGLRAPGGAILAFALYSVVLDEASLLNFGVAAASRREGLGKRLMFASLEALSRQGVSSVHLEVRASNVAARKLYESAGFVDAGVRRNYYPTLEGQEDAIIMSILWLEMESSKP
jgi:ribosomal-protein-alanine N-acetyltransferase